ncbi:MucR family transcriptional regulator [Blastococcus sp. CCUG 61487]|uniref:MucR family transcriptional regulator n=1 Tax=Blastococcus sp. CCUG 61487 TaxID=1840703 RepID=UPI0010BFA09A|nr:MucR family transcriptional regulator [Blastococcus sp. CCUG 61487]TKJ20021.1 MucR family transcriptional regulator [Blastococcus sp. CCUG 61487]
MLHPVGPLPARVYWRRRLVVLTALLAVLGGVVVGVAVLLPGGSGADAGTTDEAAPPVPTPALEQVVPSLMAVRTPAPLAPEPVEPEAAPVVAETAPAPEPGGPCTDEMLGVEVRAPAAAALGSKPTLDLVVTNVSTVPCVRDLDKKLQELILVDAAGARVWGSNDCFPEEGADVRTLVPGEAVAFPVIWGGLTSEPDCLAERVVPPAGTYAVRGRLDTKSSADVPLTLG